MEEGVRREGAVFMVCIHGVLSVSSGGHADAGPCFGLPEDSGGRKLHAVCGAGQGRQRRSPCQHSGLQAQGEQYVTTGGSQMTVVAGHMTTVVDHMTPVAGHVTKFCSPADPGHCHLPA